jgi:quinol monooxygenase YgiN
MAYAVAVRWRAREGEEEAVRAILERFAPIAREEPACRLFLVHRSPEDTRTFYLYELYDDEAGFQAHADTEAFKTHVLGDAVPRLEERVREFYETLDGT